MTPAALLERESDQVLGEHDQRTPAADDGFEVLSEVAVEAVPSFEALTDVPGGARTEVDEGSDPAVVSELDPDVGDGLPSSFEPLTPHRAETSEQKASEALDDGLQPRVSMSGDPSPNEPSDEGVPEEVAMPASLGSVDEELNQGREPGPPEEARISSVAAALVGLDLNEPAEEVDEEDNIGAELAASADDLLDEEELDEEDEEDDDGERASARAPASDDYPVRTIDDDEPEASDDDDESDGPAGSDSASEDDSDQANADEAEEDEEDDEFDEMLGIDDELARIRPLEEEDDEDDEEEELVDDRGEDW
ncbi:MAG: hypothetical protein ACFB9M_16555 [Myxococcota bacterium]